MLTDIEAVIFDMDGSLVDSMWIWTEVDRIFMEKYGLVPPKDFHKAIEGKSYTETAMYFLEAFPELNCTLEDVCAEWMEMTMEKMCIRDRSRIRSFIRIWHWLLQTSSIVLE